MVRARVGLIFSHLQQCGRENNQAVNQYKFDYFDMSALL